MEALDFLLARNLIPKRQSITYDNLVTALLHIVEAQKIPKTLEESIHSISILITDLTSSTLVAEISTSIHKRLLGANGTLGPIIAKLEDTTASIEQTATNLIDTAGKLHIDNEQVTQKLIVAIKPTPIPNTHTGHDVMYPSYAAACIPKPTNLYSSLLAKCDLHAKQVLIDKVLNMPSHGIANYSEADILSKVNKAIEKLTLTNDPSPLPKVVGIKKLPSRAMFLEMNSEEEAELFLQPTLTHDFIRNFNNTSIIRPNNYPTIVEFVTTSFNPSSKEELVVVEVANSLQPGDITTA